MNVLIIGGTRRSGPHLVRQLVAAGHRVTCLHRGVSSAELPCEVREIASDRRDPEAFREAVAGLEFEAVVDMIALNDADFRLATDCFRGRIAQYVVISSYDVYAAYEAAWFHRPYREPLPIREDAPKATARYLYGPKAGYDKGLLEDAAAHAWADEGFPVTVVRYPALYGPGDVTPREWYYVRQVLDRRPAILAPDGGQAIFSRGFLENMAHAVSLVVGNPETIGQTYNAADAGQLTVRQIIESVAEILDHRWEVLEVPDSLMPTHSPTQGLPYCCDPYHIRPHLLLDTTRMRAELGYSDLAPPGEALERTIRWLAGRPQPTQGTTIDYGAIDGVIERWTRRERE